MNIADATAAPRIHHQWLPDVLFFEPGLSEDTVDLLKQRGHKMERPDYFTRPQTAAYQDGWFYGYTDTRVPGGAACGVGVPC